jgi:hypothetical protein
MDDFASVAYLFVDVPDGGNAGEERAWVKYHQ